jgi:hypothetical protein
MTASSYGDGSRRRKRLAMIRITSSAKWGVSWTDLALCDDVHAIRDVTASKDHVASPLRD